MDLLLLIFRFRESFRRNSLKNRDVNLVFSKSVTFFVFELDPLRPITADVLLWILSDGYFVSFYILFVLELLDGLSAQIVSWKNGVLLVESCRNRKFVWMLCLIFQNQVRGVIERALVGRPSIFNHGCNHMLVSVHDPSSFQKVGGLHKLRRFPGPVNVLLRDSRIYIRSPFNRLSYSEAIVCFH